MMVAPKPLRCLYYPWSRTNSLSTLKKAILLFDQVTFLDSEPWFVRRQLLDHRPRSSAPANEDHYGYLEEQQIVQLLNPEDVIQDFDVELTAAVMNDVRDTEFCDLAIKCDVTVWSLLRERIPPSFFDAFYPGAGTFAEAISLQALIHAEGKLDDVEELERKFAEFRWKGLSYEQIKSTFLRRYRFVVGGNPILRLKSYEVPFLQASSLRINEALLIAAKSGFVPFTDSPVHDRMMNMKVSRSLKMLADHPELADQLELGVRVSLPYEHMALAVLDRLIPEGELTKRSLKELVQYRQDNQEKLARMRLALGALAVEIESVEPGAAYYRAVRNAVESKVIPEITQAQQELTKNYESAFGKLAIQSAQVTVPTLAATVFGGLGLWEILGACVFAETAFLATKGAENLLDIWRAKKVAGRGAYSYLTMLGD